MVPIYFQLKVEHSERNVLQKEIRKISNVVAVLLRKIEEVFSCSLKLTRNTQKSINLDFKICNVEVMDGVCQGSCCEFSIPFNVVRSLPENLKIMNEKQKSIVGVALNVIAHEIFHAFGALHADNGIMSGHSNILQDCSLDSLFLSNFIDHCSLNILKSSLSNRIDHSDVRPKPDTISISFINNRKVSIKMENIVNFAIFASKTFYTSSFFFPRSEHFELTTCETWDTLVLACEGGCVIKLAKKQNGQDGFNMSYGGCCG